MALFSHAVESPDQLECRGNRTARVAQRRGGFRLLDIDDEFFVIVRPAPSGTRLLLSDATAALDYDIAAEVLDNLDADIDPEDLEDAEPFEEGDLGLLSDVGLPEAVLSVILDETDLYADEQLGRIAREMGFAEELSAVIDRLGR
jgi:putative tRNA adenosine deaminase-associated protein